MHKFNCCVLLDLEYSGLVKIYNNSSDNDTLNLLDDKHVIQPYKGRKFF